jgi:antibiotic biosynthesis monooxygenase (ABM) superfamily enzyme
MAIEVIIKRKVKAGHQAKLLVPLILKLRAMALNQPGYISGETLSNIENPEECLVIGRWESVEDWNRWLNSNDRDEINKRIESLIGEQTEYRVYSPMVPQ